MGKMAEVTLELSWFLWCLFTCGFCPLEPLVRVTMFYGERRGDKKCSLLRYHSAAMSWVPLISHKNTKTFYPIFHATMYTRISLHFDHLVQLPYLNFRGVIRSGFTEFVDLTEAFDSS